MPYKLNPEQLKAVLALDTQARSTHCIGRIGDWEELWGVRNDEGWLVPCAPDEIQYFPIWPHPDYAQMTADDRFPGNVPERIALDDFMTKWLPGLKDDGVKVGVFPNMEWTMWIMEPDDLLASLEDEIAQYE